MPVKQMDRCAAAVVFRSVHKMGNSPELLIADHLSRAGPRVQEEVQKLAASDVYTTVFPAEQVRA